MKIPADTVETGRVMLLNDERWHIAETNIKPETMTFSLSKEGAHITLEVPTASEMGYSTEGWIPKSFLDVRSGVDTRRYAQRALRRVA